MLMMHTQLAVLSLIQTIQFFKYLLKTLKYSLTDSEYESVFHLQNLDNETTSFCPSLQLISNRKLQKPPPFFS